MARTSADAGESRRMRLFGTLKGKHSRHTRNPHFHAEGRAEHTLFSFRLGSLESFLRREIGIEESAALAYLSDGRRLRTDNVRDLAGAQDQVRACPLLCFRYAFSFTLHAHKLPCRTIEFCVSHHALVHICIQQVLFGRGFR
jgi:hypothetical protein